MLAKLVLSEYFNWTTEQKLNFIAFGDFLEQLDEQEIIQLLIEEEEPRILNKMSEVLQYSRDEIFRQKFDLIPFIDKLSSVAPAKQFLFVEIILHTIDRIKDPDNSDKKEKYRARILEALKTIEDPVLKAYAVNSDNHGRIFSPEMVQAIFGGSKEVELWAYHAETTGNVAENALNLLNLVRDYHPLYNELIVFFDSLEDTSKIKRQHIREFLKAFLRAYQFPVDNKLQSLFSSFSDTEETLLTSVTNYRDHITHSFRVFLLGLQILIVKRELDFRKRITPSGVHTWDELLCWGIAAFFHDVGYGIEKINEISKKIENHLGCSNCEW